MVSDTEAGGLAYVGAVDVLGQLALRDEDNQSALNWYRQLTKRRRVSGDFFLLGICESNAGNRDQAIKALEQALLIDPMLIPAHQQLALLLEQSGEIERSRLHLDVIRKIDSRAENGVRK